MQDGPATAASVFVVPWTEPARLKEAGFGTGQPQNKIFTITTTTLV